MIPDIATSEAELSPAEISTAIEALPQAPRTLPVRIEALEQDVKKVKADIAAIVAAVEDLRAVLAAVSPSGVESVVKALEGRLGGLAGAVEKHFGIKL